MEYWNKGYITSNELIEMAPTPPALRIRKGPVAILECPQLIPCNPCESACPVGAIWVGTPVTNIPALDSEACTGCGLCVSACPGLAIFIVDGAKGVVGIPFEFLPLPQVGEEVLCLDRLGKAKCRGKVVKVKANKRQDRTSVVYIKVPEELVMEVRNIKRVGNI